MTETRKFVTDRIHRLEGRDTNEFFRMEDAVQHDGEYWLAVRAEQGEFHLRRVQHRPQQWNDDLYHGTGRAHGDAYRPLHPSMTAEDIEGATYAHDDGTHWHFAHCSPAEQIDLAAEVRTFAEAQFATAIQKAQIKISEATNAPAKATAAAKTAALIAFAAAVGDSAFKAVVSATLGHWHRDPHNDHKRDLTVAAIAAVLAAWSEAGKLDKAIRQDRAHVTSAAAAANAVLSRVHMIEWRAARAARLEAERKAKEAAEAEASSSDNGAGN